MSKQHTSVLMVCLGNICRSPLAHGIFESLTPTDQFIVDSAGTAAYHVGNPPDIRSIAVAEKHHIDIRPQRARQFSENDFEEFDFVFVMDRSNLSNVLALAKNDSDRAKVALLLGDQEVPDPYYGGPKGFDDCYAMIHQACQKRLAEIQDLK